MREKGREGWREGVRKGGRKEGREGGREKGREGCVYNGYVPKEYMIIKNENSETE